MGNPGTDTPDDLEQDSAMNSLLLGLAISSSPAVAGQYPMPFPPGVRPVPVVPVAPVQPRVPVYPPTIPLPVPSPVPQPAVVAMTVDEFARCFKPLPGHYKVWLIHPKTCRPVEVCFTLPPGCPKVEVGRRRLEFDYGKREVELHFRHNGTVDVDYD